MKTPREIAKILGRGEKLTQQEEDQLTNFLQVNETVRSWVAPAASYPRLNYLEVEEADFSFLPNRGQQFYIDAEQAIPHDVPTNIIFNEDQADYMEGGLRVDPEYSDRLVNLDKNRGRVYVVLGQVDWENDAVGYRGCFLIFRDKEGNNVGGMTLAQGDAETTGGKVLNYSRTFRVETEDNYITHHVHQKSGASLNMIYFKMSFFRIL